MLPSDVFRKAGCLYIVHQKGMNDTNSFIYIDICRKLYYTKHVSGICYLP